MKALRRLRALRFLLLVLVATVATPRHADAQVDPDRVGVDFIQQSEWFGELWPADFNRDGRTDITALLNQAGSPVIVAIGRGDGTFDPAQVVASGTGTPIGVGDVNGDGFVDIVTSSHIVPGRGDGTFQAPVLYATPSAEIAPAQVLDINGDGRADLVLISRTSVHVYPGNGDFTFGARLTMPSGFETESMFVTDLNADGLPDIATTSKNADRRVNLYFNAGNMSFSTIQIPLPFDGGGITARDMNGDGLIDLIVGMGTWGFSSNVWTSGQVAVFLGLGGGAFSPPLTFPTLPGPIRVVVGDFNGDGLPDVATGNETVTTRCETVRLQWASVSVLLGRGDGTLGPAASFALGRSEMPPDSLYKLMRRLNTSDLNGDGRTDLLASAATGPTGLSGGGALLLLTPPAENRPPMVDAGPDIVLPFDPQSGNYLNGASVTDPDHDWQTFEWRDAFGRVFGDTLRSCLAANYGGTQEFTLTADDGRGGVHSDARLWTFTTAGPAPIPSGFTGENIGTVGAEGTDSYQAGNDVFTVVGSGADIWGTTDAFRFVYTTVSGNFDVTARVTRVDNIDPWTKVGLMIRQSRSAGSRHAFVFATPTAVNGVAFQRRQVDDALTVHTWGPAVAPPVWLRLTREGDQITAYSRVLATDPWTLIGTETLAGLIDPVHVGMAVTSHKDGTAATGLFQAFAVTPLSGALPAGWHTTDVGAVAAVGSATVAGGTFTVTGSGADIWETADAFRYTYTRLAGNGAITVRVASLDGPHEWSKAGLMIRESLDPAAAHHYLLASQANGLAYQRRLSTGAVTDHTGLAGSGPVWFRIQRSGRVLRLFYSLETSAPTSWQLIAKTSIARGELLVGLAVTSHADGQLATATFDSIDVTSKSGWHSADLGAVGLAGSTTTPAPGSIVMTASGTDIWETEDAFRFTYLTLTGDGTLVARVATLDAPHAWSKAGVMVRQSTDAGSPHAFMFVSRDNGLAFQRRVTASATTVHTGAGSGTAPQWLRLTRSGEVVTAAYSADGAAWTTVGAETLPIGEGPVLIGVALTSHDNTATATASFEGVAITR